MTNFDTLIDRLAADTAPMRPGAVRRTLSRATLAGCALAIVGVIIIGLRPDLGAAMSTDIFWIKLAYGGTLAATGLVALVVLVHPERPVPQVLLLALLPLVTLATLAVAEAMRLSPGDAREAWLGSSWSVCPFLIALLALPIAAALTWTASLFAPTRLRVTGAVIGFTAAALAVVIYAFHCPESGASFVATWYTLGIGLVTMAGWLAGPRLLRW
jgi:hypothetical protein